MVVPLSILMVLTTLSYATIGLSTTHYFKMEPDNFIEEVCERGIENNFNLPEGTIDLTPLSKEKK